jgi:tetratricopeptide (TPR) repeat protein
MPIRVNAQPAAAAIDSARAQAEQYAAAAFEAYGRQQYADAVALYQKAYALTPNADIILYNIARIYDSGLHDSKRAIDYYLRYAAAAGAAPNRIQISSQRIAELATSDSNRTQLPAAGATAAEANAPDVAPANNSASRARAGDSPAPLATSAPSEVARGSASSSPASSQWTARELTALTVGGIGVVGIGLGVVFGLSASAHADTWEQYCDGNECTSQKGVDAAESANRQARVATVSLTAGITLTALGTVLWFMGGPSESPNESPSGVASLRLTPVAGDGELGGSLSGRF